MSLPETPLDTHAQDVSETLKDLREDFEEIRRRTENALSTASQGDSNKWLAQLAQSYERLRDEAVSDIARLSNALASDIPQLIDRKTQARLNVRTLQSISAGVISSNAWQAPAAAYSGPISKALMGVVGLSNNEYLRGGYPAEKEYAKKFVSAYIDRGARIPPHAYLTSSGMAACTTILCSLQSDIPRRSAPGSVLVGMSTYFENKWLLEKLFPGQIIYIDEFDTDGLLSLAKEHKPALIFMDSLGNDERLAIPDLNRLIPALMRSLPLTSNIIIDNSCLAIGFQPLQHMPRQIRSPGFIVIESLNKYYEFGTDRVTGGIIWTTRVLSLDIDLARIHLGTIIPDISLGALPEPDREILDMRIRRTERNACYLAACLDERAHARTSTILDEVHYPGLPAYPGHAWTKDMSFRGCFIALRLKKPYRNNAYYSLLISRILTRAREAGISIDHGTSFGFDVTRISIAAFYADRPRRAFLRIAVGTETKKEIESVARVIGDCV